MMIIPGQVDFPLPHSVQLYAPLSLLLSQLLFELSSKLSSTQHLLRLQCQPLLIFLRIVLDEQTFYLDSTNMEYQRTRVQNTLNGRPAGWGPLVPDDRAKPFHRRFADASIKERVNRVFAWGAVHFMVDVDSWLGNEEITRRT